jgi:hypothetical protein
MPLRPRSGAGAGVLAGFLIAGLAAALPRAAASQELPEALRGSALSVRVHAFVPQAAETAGWEGDSVKYTVLGSPVGVKLVGDSAIILVQVTPFDKDGTGLFLVTQGQVWFRAGAGLSYRTTINTFDVEYGEIILFFPFGIGSDGKAPLRIEIVVSRAAGGSEQAAPPGASAASSPKK